MYSHKEAKCKECGKCCTHLTFHYPNDLIHNEWAKARGLKINQKSKSHVEYKLYHPCPQLKNNKCKLQNKKPKACIEFPSPLGLKQLNLNDDKMLPISCAYREDNK